MGGPERQRRRNLVPPRGKRLRSGYPAWEVALVCEGSKVGCPRAATQPRFWLEWGSSTSGQDLPATRSPCPAVHSEISARPSQPGCAVAKTVPLPAQAENRAEWATRPATRTGNLSALAELPRNFIAPGSGWGMGQSRSVRACLAGNVPAPPESCATSARPCGGRNWSDENRGAQIRRTGSGTAPEFQALARK